ncbi:MAG: helix-turn-helix transcriptional regulator [Pseudomonadota bacterium]
MNRTNFNQTTSKKTRKAAYDPAAIRSVFGQNLTQLAADYPSISALCRDLGVNRTQFNRYVSGESFPRPDVLHQMCVFFGVDARILLEPLNQTKTAAHELLSHPFINEYLGKAPTSVVEDVFPTGFYSFVRRSFIDDEQFTTGLVHVKRDDGYTFLHGFEPREAMRGQGLSTRRADREYRGIILRQEEGVMAIVTHRQSLACSFNFLTPETSFQSNIWEGYATRTVREKVTGRRAARMVYEYLGRNLAKALEVSRHAGLIPLDQVPPFHRKLLRLNEEFR